MKMRRKSWGGKVQGLAGGVGQSEEGEDFGEGLADEFTAHAGVFAAAVPLEQQGCRRVPDAFFVVVGGQERDGAGPRIADAADDGGQDIGEFGADEQDPFLIRLGGGNLKEGDDLAGGGQAVLDHRVVAEFQHLLDAGAGVAQDLHCGPGPERPVLGGVEVEQNPVPVAGRGAGGIHRADEHRVVDGEGGARRHGKKGLQALQSVAVVVGGGLRERLQGREAFAGPLIHAGLDPLDALAVRGLGFPDRTRRRPRPPPGRLFHRPPGDVEVEGAHRDEQQGPVGAFDHRLLDGAVGELPPPDAGPEALLPRGGDAGRQVEGVDAGVVPFQVGPEVAGQGTGEVVQRAVVQSWPALFEVVDQQLADRRAGHTVPVDELLAAQLTGDAVEVAEGDRGVGGQVSQLPQPRVEERATGLVEASLP
ncbi:hypothetical protein [Streptomyces niveus]|uniref:Uncharacterized protein n=1 Tax=Streptomyces niveus TaxID=193462 RepID=A0ABZ1ZV04_STRNV|nr:hypothetical protein [Streptomyces niveus]